ncbi:tyrosine-type recombinase/integrase [Photobacterium sp. R1]
MSNEKLPSGVEIHGKSLRISFSHNHQRCRETLNLRPTKQNIKFAAGKLAAIKHEIAIGSFNYAEHFPNSSKAQGKKKLARIDDLANEYLCIKKTDIRTSTYVRYEKCLEVCVKLYGGNRTTATLTKLSVTTWRNEISKGRTARTINSYLSVVKGFLNHLLLHEYIFEDFSSCLNKVKQPEQDPDPFSFEEFQRAVDNCRFEQHRNIITILAYTGLRIGEVCGLAWEDIDFTSGTLMVRRAVSDSRGLKTPKTDKSRMVNMLPPVIAALRSQQEISFLKPEQDFEVELSDKTLISERLRFVFSPNVTQKSTKNPFMSRITVTKLWQTACKRAGIRYRRVYQLRHTYASWMLTAGVNPSYLAEQMGHANFMMIAKVYGKWMEKGSRSENEKAWRALDELKRNMS